MIPIPPLPTDSLYKFTFVAGILFQIAAILLGYTAIENLNNQKTKVDSANDVFNTAITTFKVKTTIDSLLLQVPKINKTEILKNSREQVTILDKPLNDVTKETKNYRKVSELSIGMLTFAFVLLIEGGYLSIWGSKKWQDKIQTQNDRLLEIQVKLAERELEKKIPFLGRKHYEPLINARSNRS
jgi:hypothetical protein